MVAGAASAQNKWGGKAIELMAGIPNDFYVVFA